MGGGIFVTEGGGLTLGGNVTVNGNTVAGGTGFQGGSAFGGGMFLQGDGNVIFAPGSGQTSTFNDAIDDQTGRGGTGTNNFATGGPTCTVGVGCGVYSGAGTWSLTKSDAGTVVLSGFNRYSGGTAINAGTLTVTGIGSVGSGVVTVASGATFEIDKAGPATLANTVTGGGGLTKRGAADLQIDGTNTYSGPTNILAGSVTTFSFGNNAIGDQSDVTIAANAALALITAETIGSLSGGGRAGGTGADPRTLTTGGSGNNADFAGVLANNAFGPGGATLTVNKIGAGTQTLSGISTYTGPTAVSGGRLVVNGSIASSSGLTVGAGASIGGSGLLPTATFAAGSTLAPGNSIGTVTFNGNLTLGAGSTYAVEVSPTAADRTNVIGTANLAGATVVTTYEPGAYVDKEHVILNATAGLAGTTFAGLTGVTPLGLLQSLRYDGNNVYLVVDVIYSPLSGMNQNQTAVANAVNGYFAANGGVPGAFVGLTPDELTARSGEIATAAVGAGIDNATQFLGQISDPAITEAGTGVPSGDVSSAYAPLGYSAEPANLSSPGALAALGAEVPVASDAANAALARSSAHATDPVDVAMATRWKMWGAAYGSTGRIGGDPVVVGSADLTVRNWGIASGFDRRFGDSRIGLSLGGAGSTFSLSGGLGNGYAGVFNAGLYGSHSFGNAYVSGALAYGWNNVRTTRNVAGDTLTASYNAHTLAGRIEGGYRWGGETAVTPYVALQGGNHMLPAYTETSALGGPLALAYGRQSEAFLRSELGARFEHTMPTSNGSLKFSARAAWAYNAINDRAVSAAFVALPGQTFTINGARPARHAALIDLGVEAAFDSGLSAKLTFSGEFSRNVSAYGASAKLIWRW